MEKNKGKDRRWEGSSSVGWWRGGGAGWSRVPSLGAAHIHDVDKSDVQGHGVHLGGLGSSGICRSREGDFRERRQGSCSPQPLT